MPTLLSDLAREKLIYIYETDEGVELIQVKNFQKHQNPHPKERASEFPEHCAAKINDRPLLPGTSPSVSSPSVSCYPVIGGDGAPAKSAPLAEAPSEPKLRFALSLLSRHGMDVPPSLDREECDRIIDDLKDKKVRAGSRAPAVFPADPDLTPKEYEESIKAMRKEMI